MATVVLFCRDVSAVDAQAEAAVALATEQGFPQGVCLGTSMRGWALALQGQARRGMTQLREGIAPWLGTCAAVVVPALSTFLADVSLHLGHTADGLQALTEAHT